MKKFLYVLPVLILLAAGCSKSNQEALVPPPVQSEVAQTPPPVAQTQPITYKGVEGKTALELLKANYQTVTKEFQGIGKLVETINGVTPDSNHFWAFYVNGKTSTVGAGSYVTKANDVIEWKVEEIK